MATETEAAGGHEEALRGWFAGRLPAGWFTGTPDIKIDREEITVVGTIPGPERAADANDAEAAGAADSVKRPASTESKSPGRPNTSSAGRFPGAYSATARG